MRFYYVALVFAVTLLSTSDGLSMNSKQNQVPALIELKAARSDGVINRSLRTADTTDEDDEERAILNAVAEVAHKFRFKLAMKKAKTPEAKNLVQFGEWLRQKKTPDEVAMLLDLSKTITGKGAAYDKFKAYESFWLTNYKSKSAGINFHVTPKDA